ncbi:protein CUSTOS [Pseudochaenichthys georgianus]|uniref:protein CUSTOS n=1 Tax=Pseudochaenichthys georgianus TaxID=52239 RepID=UPI0039C45491
MAARAKKIVGVSEDSSSSEDEVLRRCQEAVWETRSDTKKDGGNVQQSKRIVVADHDHDGNELQVTQGFRTHVAKKLGNLLDSRFTEMKTESCAESAKCDDDDEGFLLFSTSVPGQAAVEAPAPVRRRPISSSSDTDSEMEMRLREAAVSIKDLLPSFSLPSTLSTPSSELPCSENIKEKKNVVEEKENHIVKKKKKKRKRKRKQEKSEQVDSAGSPVNDEHGNSGQEHTQVKVKRKKKRHTEEEV